MAFIAEATRIMKSMRGIESAQKTEAISQMERYIFPMKKEKEVTFNRDVTVG
jgi:hypothetical protein